MKNPDIFICEIIESKMNEIIDKINEMNSAIEADPLHSELRILDWILYQVCSNEIKGMQVVTHFHTCKWFSEKDLFVTLPPYCYPMWHKNAVLFQL
jgi:hypothetical protein